MQSFQQANREHDSKNTIVSPRVRNCIEVRSDEQPRAAGLSGWIQCAQIASGIHPDRNPEGFEPASDFAVTIAHRRRKKCPSRTGLVL